MTRTISRRLLLGAVPGTLAAGALARYGLSYDDLKPIAPRLVYCSVTGFGQDGPLAPDSAYDFGIQAMGSLMSVTGERDDQPGGGPHKVGVPIIDLTTGFSAAIAVLAGLAARERTGQGDHIDLGMLDEATALLANQGMSYLLTGCTPQPVRDGAGTGEQDILGLAGLRGARTTPPEAATMPCRTPGSAKRASSAAASRSQASTISKPPPTAAPCTAAIQGLARGSRTKPPSGVEKKACGCPARTAARSASAQTCGGAPVNTTARTASSASSIAAASPRARAIA